MSRTPTESHQHLIVAALTALNKVRPLMESRALDSALCRAHDWSLDPTGSSEGPRAVGGHSDPTYAAATNRTADEGHEYRRLMSMLETIEQTCTDIIQMEKQLRPVTGSAAYHRFLEHTGTEANRVIECGQDTCPDAAVTGSPYCAPCTAYLATRPGIAVVPRDALQARSRKREERTRVHVTGPFAEQEAS